MDLNEEKLEKMGVTKVSNLDNANIKISPENILPERLLGSSEEDCEFCGQFERQVQPSLLSAGRHPVCSVHQHKFTIRETITPTALLETCGHFDQNVLGQN